MAENTEMHEGWNCNDDGRIQTRANSFRVSDGSNLENRREIYWYMEMMQRYAVEIHEDDDIAI